MKIDEDAPQTDPPLTDTAFLGYHTVLRHGWNTPNESALWFINGDFYYNHRHKDHGNVIIYALGAPLSLDFGSYFQPDSSSSYLHSVITPEATGGHPWDQGDVPFGNAPQWTISTPKTFLSVPSAAIVSADFENASGLRWNRNIRSLRANESAPIFLIEDSFEGNESSAPKVFSMTMMARGSVQTPAGPMTPPQRFHRSFSSPRQLPSAGTLFTVPGGIGRFGFQGQWLIDWDLYSFASEPRQAHIGHWGHDWNHARELGEFRAAQKREFIEEQYLLRIRAEGSFRTVLVPYPKGKRPGNLQVSESDGVVRIISDTETNLIGQASYLYEGPAQRVLTALSQQEVTAFGWNVSGGPAEVRMSAGRFVVTAFGGSGLRRIRIPGEWVIASPLQKVGDEYQLEVSGPGQVSASAQRPNFPPQLELVPAQMIEERAEFVLQLAGSDPNLEPQKLTHSLVSGPEGLTVAPGTGVVSWIPTETDGGGQFMVSVRVTDRGEPPMSTEQTFTITVNEVNSPPTMMAIPTQSVTEGMAFNLQPNAMDLDLPANAFKWSLGAAAPAGMTIDTTTGAISWTPGESQGSASYSVTVSVTDNGVPPLSATETITITVNEVNSAPQLAVISDQSVEELSELTFATVATDVDLPANKLTFSLAPGAPEGVAIAPEGVFRWTPTEAQGPGTFPITIRATDDGTPPLSAEQTFTVTVNEVNSPPQLSVISAQSIEVGRELMFAATAMDADLPPNILTFSFATGAPGGATITPSGVFSWTPTEAQAEVTYPITVVVTDDGSPPARDSKIFNVAVAATQREIKLMSVSLLGDGRFSFSWDAQEGRSYRVQVKTALSDLTWNDAEATITTSSGKASFTASATERAERFYRVVSGP